jgi:hypothetical protein
MVTDPLPPGVTMRGPATCSASGVAVCGTLSGGTGSTTFAASGAMVAAGAGNVLEYRIPVRFGAGMLADPLVNTATATADGGATASASDSNVRTAPAEMLAIPVDSRVALVLLVIVILAARAAMWRRIR